MQPMLEVILAHWYWDYFQQNRWRFLQRTQTDQPTGDDLLSWDLPRILAEIDRHFAAALAAEKWLQETPVEEFGELLVEGSMPDTHRPTLFDFVAYEALRFYSAGEQAGAAAQDTFVLQADSPILDSPAEFIAWKIEATDAQSPTLKAIRLYQRLLEFHTRADHRTALAEADLSRLEFGSRRPWVKRRMPATSRHWSVLASNGRSCRLPPGRWRPGPKCSVAKDSRWKPMRSPNKAGRPSPKAPADDSVTTCCRRSKRKKSTW